MYIYTYVCVCNFCIIHSKTVYNIEINWGLWVKKQQLELDIEQWTGSKWGKEYNKAIYYMSPCLFNFSAEYIMWSTGLDES